MLLNILKYPDPFLKTKAKTVDVVTDELRELLDNMLKTMYVEGGIGLAATQVGVAKRVVVLDIPITTEDEYGDEQSEQGKNVLKLVNPVITDESGETTYEEGCLSVPGVRADVKRSAELRLQAMDEDGKDVEIHATGLLAIAIQHEVDHLNGVLFIDRLGLVKRDLIKRRLKKAAAAKAEDIADAKAEKAVL
jgi:peptide deformylase